VESKSNHRVHQGPAVVTIPKHINPIDSLPSYVSNFISHWPRAASLWNWVSFPGWGKIIFCFSKRPDRFWNLLSYLFSGGSSSGIYRPVHNAKWSCTSTVPCTFKTRHTVICTQYFQVTLCFCFPFNTLLHFRPPTLANVLVTCRPRKL